MNKRTIYNINLLDHYTKAHIRAITAYFYKTGIITVRSYQTESGTVWVHYTSALGKQSIDNYLNGGI